MRYHFTLASIEKCQDAEEKKRAGTLYETWQEARERRDREERAAEREAATAAHTPEPFDSAAVQTISFHGEKQLLALSPWQMPVVGLLTTAGVYRLNCALRKKSSLEGAAGAPIDWAGYPSNQAFLDDALTVLGHLGEALSLEEPLRLFRGISVPREPSEVNPDIAGVGGHLAYGMAWDTHLVDRGFGFATTLPEVAAQYPQLSTSESHERRILVELEATRGLCLPCKDHRSPELFGMTYGVDHIGTTSCQVIFAPNTSWEVTGVELDSSYGVPVVGMKQVAT